VTERDLSDYRRAPSGDGPLAAQWADKPHRLVYDLCGEVERLRARVAELERNRPWAADGGDFANWRRWLVHQPLTNLLALMDAEVGKSEAAAEAEEELYDLCCLLADGDDAAKEGTE